MHSGAVRACGCVRACVGKRVRLLQQPPPGAVYVWGGHFLSDLLSCLLPSPYAPYLCSVSHEIHIAVTPDLKVCINHTAPCHSPCAAHTATNCHLFIGPAHPGTQYPEGTVNPVDVVKNRKNSLCDQRK